MLVKFWSVGFSFAVIFVVNDLEERPSISSM